MGSYVFLAILGMVAYSITTIFVKIAAREVRRGWLAALKGLDQREWRCMGRSDKYVVARLDNLDGRLGR